MSKMFYRPSDAYVGDVIPYYSEGQFYLYYLHDPRKQAGEFAEDTTWHLVTTKDFIHFKNRGTALRPGDSGKANHNIYTGSVVKDASGIFHAFYTGFNPKNQIDGKPLQVIMQATSKDLLDWENMDNFILRSDGDVYEEFDWRDPYVFWNEQAKCYYLIVTTRHKNSSPHRGGCLGLCTSTDLVHWEYKKPFYSPNMYITMECSDLFQMNGWWYLVFSTFSDRFATHYRMAKSLNGPWIIPENDTLDARGNYAIKTATDGKKRFCFGWVPSKDGESDFGAWNWGGNLVIHEVIQDETNGCLKVSMPDTWCKEYTEITHPEFSGRKNCLAEERSGEFTVSAETFGGILFHADLKRAVIHVKMKMGEGTESFGIAVRTDENFDNGYFLKFEPKHNRVVLDMWPRAVPGKYQWQIRGDQPFLLELERFYRIEPGKEFDITIQLDDDICVFYVDKEIALTARMYNRKGGSLGFYATQGSFSLKNLCCIKI